ncbi:unnamed protein product [Absidia cylindrospora]
MKRRRFDNGSNSNSNNRQSKYGGPTGPVGEGRGVYCGYGCGEVYMKGHIKRKSRRLSEKRSKKAKIQVTSTPKARDSIKVSGLDGTLGSALYELGDSLA